MTRRTMVAGFAPLALRARQRPPNFLVVVADDHGWDDLGCYGHPVVQTPNLDRLAREGIRFTHCFTTAPLCSPGRGAVLTGLYPHVSGVTRLVQGEVAERVSLRPEVWTFAQGLRDLGYETIAAGKWHLSMAGPTAHGFEYYIPQSGGLRQSTEYLQRVHDRPFCFYFGPTQTHRPYRRYDGFPYLPEAVGAALPPYLKDTPLVREHYANYLSATSKMDQEIGDLVAALARSGELDRTIVAYMTDHGPSMHRAKFSLYEWGTHSSLIFRGPGISGSGRVDTDLASTVDIAPTLLALAGGAAPKRCQGTDISSRLAARPAKARSYVFSEHHEGNHLVAVRGERFKLIRNLTLNEPLVPAYVIRNWQQMDVDVLRCPYVLPRPREEFYDLAADPLETRNLAGCPGYDAMLSELRRELDAWAGPDPHELMP